MADYDPTAPDILESPWDAYDELRRSCPVHRSEALEHPLYSLARHEDVKALLSDAELFTREPVKFRKATEALTERQTKLAAAEDEWLELAEKAEG